VVRHALATDGPAGQQLGEGGRQGLAEEALLELGPLLVGHRRILLDHEGGLERSGEKLLQHLPPVGVLLQDQEGVSHGRSGIYTGVRPGSRGGVFTSFA
jgi:hypothetical protein